MVAAGAVVLILAFVRFFLEGAGTPLRLPRPSEGEGVDRA